MLEETNTYKNLATAFAMECQDGAKYQFLRKKAENEGYKSIGDICQAHATNDMAHAKILFDFITKDGKECAPNVEICANYPFKAGELIDMLKLFAGDKLEQATVIYPNFAQIAQDEGQFDIAKKFEQIGEVERTHYLTLEQIYTKLEKDTLYTSDKAIMWRCLNCGHEDTKQNAWQTCPLCNSPQGEIAINMQF